MSELKPCPAECLHTIDRGGPSVFMRRRDIWGVYCQTCQCSTEYYPTEAEAIAAWNTRQPDPAPVDAVALPIHADDCEAMQRPRADCTCSPIYPTTSRVTELERENAALRAAGEAVKGFAGHREECESNTVTVRSHRKPQKAPRVIPNSCTCGLDEALNKWKDATK